MTRADLPDIFDQAKVIEPEDIKGREPQAVTMTLERKFRNNAANGYSGFTKAMREMLQPAALDALQALIEITRTSKNAQARCAAARQILRVAYSVKVLEADPFKEMVDGLAEIGELENDMGRED